jgi:PASTA domain/NPCBM/NEW2 domain
MSEGFSALAASAAPLRLRRTGQRIRRWFRDRRVTFALVAVVLAGIFAGGTAFGWWAADRYGDRSAPAVGINPGGSVVAAGNGAVVPDVRGLTASEAKQVLTDLGLGVAEVNVRQAPSVGVPGRVVAQEPPAGQPVTATVTLVVAAPAVIPAVVGQPVAQVSRDLEQLGAQVVVQRVYRPQATVDTVLSVSPDVGQPATGNVVLTVASPPAAINLSDLRPVKGGCSNDDSVNINGTEYRHSLRCAAYRTANEVEYLLNRRTARLEAVLGQGDSTTPGRVVRFEILGDGRPLASGDLGYGQSQSVGVSTDGVLRLTLRVTVLNLAPTDSASVPAVFGAIRVIGGPSDVVSLTEAVR